MAQASESARLLLRKIRNGWSQADLTVIWLLATPIAWSQSKDLSENASTLVLNDRTLLYLAGLLLAHAAVPLCRYGWQVRTNRKSYRAFLISSINSAKQRYGDERPTTAVRQTLPESEHYDDSWLKILESQGAGAPELLCMMAEAVTRRINGNHHNKKYVPYISYAGMPTAELNHEHPIWLFSKKDNSIISHYLLSELQVERSVKELYSSPLIELATSEIEEDRNRWTRAAFSLVAELAEHYINSLNLEAHLIKTSSTQKPSS